MSELNEKIVTCIDSRGMRNFDRNAFQSFNAEEIEQAAKAIEILVLEEMKELLKNFYYGDGLKDDEVLDFYKRVMSTANEDLTERLNQLKQQ